MLCHDSSFCLSLHSPSPPPRPLHRHSFFLSSCHLRSHLHGFRLRLNCPFRKHWTPRIHTIASHHPTVVTEDSNGQSSSVSAERIISPETLPWHVNASLSIHCWGIIYSGPYESKYWNLTKSHPYPVGFTSVKLYKGQKFRQTIHSGAKGPVFVVEDENLRVLTADTPQKVWSAITMENGAQVHGGRHFGFQSQKVVQILQRMAGHSEEIMLEPKHSAYSYASHEVNQEILENGVPSEKTILALSSVEQEKPKHQSRNTCDDEDSDVGHVVNHEITIDKHEKNEDDNDDNLDNKYPDSDDDDFVSAFVISDDDITMNDNDVDDNDMTDPAEEEEEENTIIERNQGNGNEHEGDSFMFQEKNPDGDYNATFNKADYAGNAYRRTFKSGPWKFTFKRTPSTVSEPDKHETRGFFQGCNERNTMYNISNSVKSKPMGGLEKQIWRKGEGLTGKGIGNGKQNKTGDQWDPNNGRNRTAFNDSRGTRIWEGSVLKKRDGNIKSSHMLLELLQKWNKVNRWNQGPTTRFSRKVEMDSMNSSGGADRDGKMLPPNIEDSGLNGSNVSVDGYPHRQDSQYVEIEENTSSKCRDSVLNELKASRNINESTEFAVRKLFETVGKKDTEIKSEIKFENLTLEESKNSSLGMPDQKDAILNLDAEALEMNSDTNFISSFQVLNNSVHDEPVTSTIQQKRELLELPEKKIDQKVARFAGRIFDNLEEKIEMQQRGVEEIKCIADLRNLITSRRFEDAFQAVRNMKSSGMNVDEDIYEVILGFKLDAWQKLVFRQVRNGNSVLISAPSGSGKSAVAECCIYRNIVDEQRVLFVTPTEHLAEQKLQSFGSLFGQKNVGGMWTKMRVQKGPQLVVLTLNALAKILQELNGPGGSEFRFFFEGINMVVLDKFHTFGDGNHGQLLEEVLMLLDHRIKIMALALPFANEDEIASWIDSNRGCCKLVSCLAESVPKKYHFGHNSSLYPLLDSKGIELNSALLNVSGGFEYPLAGNNLELFFCRGYDKTTFQNILSKLDVNGMLPAFVVFLSVEGCSSGMEDAIAALGDGLLSRSEVQKTKAFISELGEIHSDILSHLDSVDIEGLHKGIATYHEGKLPLWREFILKLYREELLKVLIITEDSLLHTEMVAQTIIMPTTGKVTKDGVSSIPCGTFMELVGHAGRRGHDVEGNVIFMKSIYTGPKQAASLVLNNNLSIESQFKPSYSLVVNLMAKHKLSEVKRIFGRTFSDFVFYMKTIKDRGLEELDKKVLDLLEGKAALELKLHHGLTEINRKKLSDAVMFTRLNIRRTIHSASETGNAMPGILLAVVPGQTETFYMVFGADNNFRLLPAGAFDHVYSKEVPPLDAVYKQATGESLQPPLIPIKENWIVEQNGSYGYVARGDFQTKQFVRLMLEYPVHPMFAKEGIELRNEIVGLETQISELIKKRKNLQMEKHDVNKKLDFDGPDFKIHGSDNWKEALRLLNILEKADAVSIVETQNAHIKLKPLGMLISRLPNVENELWLAKVITSNYVKQSSPAEFIGILATLVREAENLFIDQSEFLYRVPKPLKEAFTTIEVLRKQVAALQGSNIPPLHFDTTFVGMVYAWARAKPGTNGFSLVKTNDGAVAWKLKALAQFANLVYKACTQVSVDISEPNDFDSLSSLARRAEDMLTRHLSSVQRSTLISRS